MFSDKNYGLPKDLIESARSVMENQLVEYPATTSSNNLPEDHVVKFTSYLKENFHINELTEEEIAWIYENEFPQWLEENLLKGIINTYKKVYREHPIKSVGTGVAGAGASVGVSALRDRLSNNEKQKQNIPPLPVRKPKKEEVQFTEEELAEAFAAFLKENFHINELTEEEIAWIYENEYVQWLEEQENRSLIGRALDYLPGYKKSREDLERRSKQTLSQNLTDFAKQAPDALVASPAGRALSGIKAAGTAAAKALVPKSTALVPKSTGTALVPKSTGTALVPKSRGTALVPKSRGISIPDSLAAGITGITVARRATGGEGEQSSTPPPVSARSAQDVGTDEKSQKAAQKEVERVLSTPEARRRKLERMIPKASDAFMQDIDDEIADEPSTPPPSRPAASARRKPQESGYQAAKRAVPGDSSDPGATATERLKYMAGRGNRAARKALTGPKEDWRKSVFNKD